MKITLHYAPITCSLVPYIGLLEAEAEFDVHVVDFKKGEHVSAEYLLINPKHKVPALTIDGQTLTENVSILQWIAAAYPLAALLPRGGLNEFRAISFLAWCASGIHPSLTPQALPQRYCNLPGTEDNVRECARRILIENYQIAEAQLEGREWFFDGFTLADAYFFWCFRRGKSFGLDVTGFPNCGAHFERMSLRASVQQLIEFEEQTLANLRSAH